MGRTTARLAVENIFDVQKVAEGAISPDQVRRVELDAIVDTGASLVCLPRSDIAKLGLLLNRTVPVRTANGGVTRRTFMGARIILNGRDFQMEIMENDDQTPPLIGVLILEVLDLVVDPKSEKLIANPAHDGQWVLDLY